jgi:hypothetical protein
MAVEWVRVADRGRVDLHVLTVRRARAEGIVGEVNGEDFVTVRGTRCKFLLSMLADGQSERTLCWSTDEQSVREWIRDMEPHSLQILVADGEDQQAIAAALRGEVH